MRKVDCIVEFGEEKFNEGLMVGAKILLSKGFSALDVSKDTDIPIEKVKELEKEVMSSK